MIPSAGASRGGFCGSRLMGVSVYADRHLYLLFVSSACRARGVGRALMDEFCASGGLLTLNAAPSAHGFYLACGFQDAGARREQDGIVYIPMFRRV